MGLLRHPLVALRRAQRLPRWVRRADRWLNHRINTGSPSRSRDAGLRSLSHAADRGRLWFAIAALLVLAGRPRAAARASLSLIAASALANLVGKRLFGGPRPELKHIPFARRLRRYPTSASFPSGHSASAAGFATGVALESPAAGAVVAPIAAAVAYSRLHVGAHWPSDVVAGVLIGAGAASVGRLLVPARVPAEQPLPGTGKHIPLPPVGDGEGVFIVLNAKAGKDVLRADPRPAIRRRLPAAVQHELSGDESPGDALRAAMAGDTPPTVLGVLGGDGSVSRAAALAREFDLPLLALPGGTFKHFARAAGVSTVDVALDAAAAGTGLEVSAADLEVDGARFTVLNTLSVGIYPDFVAVRKRHKKRIGKWLASVVAAWQVLRVAEPVEVTVDGRPARVWSLFASVGRNSPEQVSILQRRSLDDDVFDVRILHARGSRLRAVTSMAFGRRTAVVLRALRLLPERSDVESFLASDLRLQLAERSGAPVGLAHDGELEVPRRSDGSGYSASAEVHAGALRIYAP